ncbi:MAG: hypothetical protein ACI8TQ_003370 [Planctomycetota bacterium]|jgi:hypothetical protein
MPSLTILSQDKIHRLKQKVGEPNGTPTLLR